MPKKSVRKNMKEELELVRQLRTLKDSQKKLRSEREKIFLSNLKNKLGVYMAQNPARPVTANLHWQLWNYITQNGKSGRLYTEQTGNGVRMGKFENFYYNIKEADPFVSLKNIGLFNNSFTGSAALAVIILAVGIGGIASASQASLPGDNLYSIKILSEELRSALTASPAAKALLEAEFSAKRIEEIKNVVQKNGVESKNIDVALNRLQKNTAKAADIIDEEKQNGNDVSALAKNINAKMDSNQEALREIFDSQIENMKNVKKSLKEKIKEAESGGNSALAESLAGQLEKTQAAQKTLERNHTENDKLLKMKVENTRNNMKESEKKASQKEKSQKNIIEAEKRKQNLINGIIQEKLSLPEGIFSGFDDLLAGAKNAFAKEDFDNAQNSAQDALDALEEIEKEMEDKNAFNGENKAKKENNGGKKDDGINEAENNKVYKEYNSRFYEEKRERE